MDARAIEQKLGSALTAQDSNAIANVLQLPPIARTKKGQEPKAQNPRPFTINGVDYASVLTSFLDACVAAESVSQICWVSIVNVTPGFFSTPFLLLTTLGLCHAML